MKTILLDVNYTVSSPSTIQCTYNVVSFRLDILIRIRLTPINAAHFYQLEMMFIVNSNLIRLILIRTD